jgi:transcription initiation factor TFIID subunit 3
LSDLTKAFDDMGVSVNELEDYVHSVEPVPFPNKIPLYPVPKESNLNFLKPGSREVVLRPIYIHDHLPPMYPEVQGSYAWYDSYPRELCVAMVGAF